LAVLGLYRHTIPQFEIIERFAQAEIRN
jgi:hypothetical protein